MFLFVLCERKMPLFFALSDDKVVRLFSTFQHQPLALICYLVYSSDCKYTFGKAS